MNQESLTEPPSEPPEETLKKIAEAIEQDSFLRLCLCLDGAELNVEPPNRITSTTKRGNSTTIRVEIKKTQTGGQNVKLVNEKEIIVCFYLRSP